jgi:biotin carboxyl carrier protein
MLVNFEVVSPCQGIVEQVFIQKNGYIYEGETLFVIHTGDEIVPVSISFSGSVKQIEVRPGDTVIPGMVLAYIQEDIVNLRTGSD